MIASRTTAAAAARSALISTLVLAGLLGPQAAALAQQPANQPQRSWDLRLGAGALYQPDYEGSDDYEVDAAPVLSVSYRQAVFLRGPMLGANLLTLEGPLADDRVQLGPLVRYRFGRDEDDNDALRGLGDIDDSIELGAFATYSFAPWSLGLELFQDVSGAHEGLTAELSAGYAARLGPKLRMRSELSASWASGSYMESFFGISGAQARQSGLQRHEAEAGVKDVGLSLNLDYAVTESWKLTTLLGYQRLLGDAADSPIVEDEGSPDQLTVGLFLSYGF